MTLDEAIIHAEEVAELHENRCKYYTEHNMPECMPPSVECAAEHHQLAEWLKELKAYREHNSIPASSENRVKLEHIECEDAVSRTDVFNAIRGEERGGYVDEPVEYMLKVMSNLPSAVPKREENRIDDLISRQAAIDVCNKAIDLWQGQLGEGILIAVRKKIEELPSAQPEIVRCKDCKHHWTHSSMDAFPREICDLDQTFYDSNFDYCSMAERKDNG